MKILDTPRSGSVAGVTASRNRFGQYYRTRAIPVQPRSPKQTANRAVLAQGSSQWRSLSDAQRTAWNDYAAQLTRSGSLGSSYSPTGASIYTGAAIILQGGGIADPPSVLPTWNFSVGDMAYVDSTPGPEALNLSLGSTSADNNFICDTSGPVSPGITSAAAVRRWRSLPSSAVNNYAKLFAMTATPVNMITQYKFLFPSPAVGQVIWFRFRELFFEPLGATPIANRVFSTYRLIIA